MKKITSGFFGTINRDFTDKDVRRFESDLANASDYINHILQMIDQIKRSDESQSLNRYSTYEDLAREIEFELDKLKMHLYPYIQ